MALSKETLKELEQQLMDMKQELLDKENHLLTESADDSTGELNTGIDNHLGDSAGDLYERERQQTFEQVDQEMLDDINEALERIREGTYGICIDSGQEIPLERLKALPYAKRTIEAQQQHEDRKNGVITTEQAHEENTGNLMDKDTLAGDTLTMQRLKQNHDAF